MLGFPTWTVDDLQDKRGAMKAFLWKGRFTAGTLLFFVLAIALCACGSDGASDSDGDQDNQENLEPIADLIAKGKAHLVKNEYEQAMAVFQQVVDREPDNRDGLFGEALADAEHWFYMMGVGLESLNNAVVESHKVDPVTAELGRTEKALVTDALVDLLRQSDEQVKRLEKLQSLDLKDWTFELDHFQFIVKKITVMDLYSEWDEADTYALSSFSRTLHALLMMLSTQNVENVLEDELGDVISADNVAKAVAQLFAKYPEFLTIRADGGAELWIGAGVELRKAAEDFLHAAELAQAETDDQSNDVFLQRDSLTHDGVQHFALQGAFNTGKSQVELLWSGKEYSLETTLTNLALHLKGNAALRMAFEDDLVMMVGVLADFLVKAVGVEDLAGIFGLELDQQTLGMIDLVVGNPKTGESLPKNLINIVLPMVGLANGSIEMDLYTFFSRPYPMREFTPNIGTNPFTDDPAFLTSYECARLGFDREKLDVGDTLGFALHDRSPVANAHAGLSNDQAVITVRSIVITGDDKNPVETVIDEETVQLSEGAKVEGHFVGDISTRRRADAEKGNGMLEAPTGAIVRAVYLDRDAVPAEGEDPTGLETKAEIAKDGKTTDRFYYGLSCKPGTGRDYDHFAQPEFVDAYRIADPAEEPKNIVHKTPYPVIAADGVAGEGPYMPFRSASFNGVLWLNMGKTLGTTPTDWGFSEGFALADARMTNAFLQKLITKLQSSGGLTGR